LQIEFKGVGSGGLSSNGDLLVSISISNVQTWGVGAILPSIMQAIMAFKTSPPKRNFI